MSDNRDPNTLDAAAYAATRVCEAACYIIIFGAIAALWVGTP